MCDLYTEFEVPKVMLDREYEKPRIERCKGMDFPLAILESASPGQGLSCKQCSSCHGCR